MPERYLDYMIDEGILSSNYISTLDSWQLAELLSSNTDTAKVIAHLIQRIVALEDKVETLLEKEKGHNE